MRVHKEHRIECSKDRFFELMFDADVERRMNLEGMEAAGFEVLEHSLEGATWRLRSRVTPKDNMPGFMKKLIGTVFSYEEQRTYQKGGDRASAALVPSSLKDKVRMAYEIRVVPEGDNACRRIMDWDIEVKIFGVGGQIEKFAGGEIERGMDASARFLNEHLRKTAA